MDLILISNEICLLEEKQKMLCILPFHFHYHKSLFFSFHYPCNPSILKLNGVYFYLVNETRLHLSKKKYKNTFKFNQLINEKRKKK